MVETIGNSANLKCGKEPLGSSSDMKRMLYKRSDQGERLLFSLSPPFKDHTGRAALKANAWTAWTESPNKNETKKYNNKK